MPSSKIDLSLAEFIDVFRVALSIVEFVVRKSPSPRELETTCRVALSFEVSAGARKIALSMTKL